MNLAIRPYFLGLMVITLMGFGIERLIVTDKEAIQALGEDLAEAIQKQDYGRLEGSLDPDFEYRGRDRTEALEYVRRRVRQYQPLNIKVEFLEIRVEDDTAKAAGNVSALVLGRPWRGRIDATLVRTDDGDWVLKSVEGDGLPR